MNNIYLLSDKKIDGATNLPVFDIEYIKLDIELSAYDALLFTSKNALYSLEYNKANWKDIPSYAIAKQTADTVTSLGGKLKFTGNTNHGDKFALELVEELKNKKVLYIGGTKKVSNIVEILNMNNVYCHNAMIYKAVCKKKTSTVVLPKGSIVIFSSPSTIECFLNNYKWNSTYKAICIGKTTAKYFPSNIDPIISNDTTLISCVQKAKELY